MNPEIVKLTPDDMDDFCSLLRVFEKVFEWDNFLFPNRPHLQKVLADAKFMVFVARADEQLVGGLTAYVLDSYTTERLAAYIYDVAVLQGFQRKGIGRLLIAALNDSCQKKGFQEVYVQAEIADSHAIDFYRSTPVSSELPALHFTYSFDKSNMGNN